MIHMKGGEGCEVDPADDRSMREVRSKMLGDKIFFKISEDFKIFSDPTRVKILYALSLKEMCVRESSFSA